MFRPTGSICQRPVERRRYLYSISVREGLAVIMSESKRTGGKINVESYPFTIFYAAHYYMMVISAYLYAIYRCKRRSNFLYELRE